MIGAHRRALCGPILLGRRVAPRPSAQAQPGLQSLTSDRLAVEVVRHLNAEDPAGFRRVVAPTVRLSAAGCATETSASELFTRLSTLVPGQTLCASRIRATDCGARIDLEVAWPVADGDVAASSLGTLELEVAAGRVVAITLDLDIDPSVRLAAAALAAHRGILRRAFAR